MRSGSVAMNEVETVILVLSESRIPTIVFRYDRLNCVPSFCRSREDPASERLYSLALLGALAV